MLSAVATTYADILSWAVVILALLGAGLTITNMKEGALNLHALHRAKIDGGRIFSTRMDLVSQGLLLLGHCACLLAGSAWVLGEYRMVTDPTLTAAIHPLLTIMGVRGVAMFLTASVFFAKSLLWWYTRYRLLGYYAEA